MTLMTYFGGAITGFTLAVIATLFLIPLDMNLVLLGQSWLSLNLGSSVYSTPVPANGTLFIATRNRLFALKAGR